MILTRYDHHVIYSPYLQIFWYDFMFRSLNKTWTLEALLVIRSRSEKLTWPYVDTWVVYKLLSSKKLQQGLQQPNNSNELCYKLLKKIKIIDWPSLLSDNACQTTQKKTGKCVKIVCLLTILWDYFWDKTIITITLSILDF